jgi:hypothetical protein
MSCHVQPWPHFVASRKFCLALLLYGLPCSPATAADSLPPTTAPEAWLSKTPWRIQHVDSEASMGANGPGTAAIDGLDETFWHTARYPVATPMPHELQIDLGMEYVVSAFRYLPRQDSASGRIRDYLFYVSRDGVNWGQAVAQGRWWSGRKRKWLSIEPNVARYVRLVALSEVNGQPWAAVAELDIYGAPTAGLPPAQGNTATLTWSAPTTHTDGSPLMDLAGFVVYHSATSGNYTAENIVARLPAAPSDIGTAQSFVLTNLDPGPHYMTVTAYDSGGNESARSAEAFKYVP